MGISGYIIEKYNTMANAYTCNRLVEEAKKLGIEVQIIGVHDTLVTKDGIYNAGQKLQQRDFVLNRYKWGELKAVLNRLGKRSYNALEPYQIYINKYQQVQNLCSDEFLVPKYV